MLFSLLHPGYKKAITARLSGRGQNLTVPDGGRTALVFNQALFMTVGRLARLDGQVTPRAIANCTRLMGLLGLDPAARQLAVDAFHQGKDAVGPVLEANRRLLRFIGRCSDLTRLYLTTLGEAASLDGGIGLQQRILLRNVAEICGFSKSEYAEICLQQMPYGEYLTTTLTPRLSAAYDTLQLTPGAGKKEIKRAYLRLVSHHHPDKLEAEAGSAESIRAASDRFISIQQAYEALSGHRKLRA